MIFSRKIAVAVATICASSSSTSCIFVAAFSTPFVSSTKLGQCSSILRATTTADGDTDTILPSFDTKEEYTSYLKAAGKLPSGFAVGTAIGKFVSVEAPAMGELPIKATVIHLTEGPTDSWAAVFTSNKVCLCCNLNTYVYLLQLQLHTVAHIMHVLDVYLGLTVSFTMYDIL